MNRRVIITALIAAVVHFVVTFGLVLFTIEAGMGALDDPNYQTSAIERVTDSLARALLQPGMSFWTPWMSKHMPQLVEWVVVMANSLLWGFAIALIIHAYALRKRKKLNHEGTRAFPGSGANAASRGD